MKYEHNIQDIMDVEFEGDPKVIADVSYESSKFGTEYGVVVMEEDPTWDRSLYTPEQNALIENNLQDVIDGMCDQYEEEINPKPDIFKAIARALNPKNWMI